MSLPTLLYPPSASRTLSASADASRAYALVDALQSRFVAGLEKACLAYGYKQTFVPAEWLRAGGTFGGGVRLMAPVGDVFNRASVNVSQVHYTGEPDKTLDSASAISTIIHPCEPLAPSVHIHISWTEMRGGDGYWRMMADLNPSNPNDTHTQFFAEALKKAAGVMYAEGAAQGDRYFLIPVLDRHRGVTHFYLEQYRTADAEADFALAKSVGEAAIDAYIELFRQSAFPGIECTEDAQQNQLAYHTLYFFQVLTLDRGTTSGLLVHDENDVGILGSLPAHVDRALLQSWCTRMSAPQDTLLDALVAAIPESGEISDEVKQSLASAVRQHYISHPKALSLQASGDVIPPTVGNHEA